MYCATLLAVLLVPASGVRAAACDVRFWLASLDLEVTTDRQSELLAACGARVRRARLGTFVCMEIFCADGAVQHVEGTDHFSTIKLCVLNVSYSTTSSIFGYIGTAFGVLYEMSASRRK